MVPMLMDLNARVLHKYPWSKRRINFISYRRTWKYINTNSELFIRMLFGFIAFYLDRVYPRRFELSHAHKLDIQVYTEDALTQLVFKDELRFLEDLPFDSWPPQNGGTLKVEDQVLQNSLDAMALLNGDVKIAVSDGSTEMTLRFRS